MVSSSCVPPYNLFIGGQILDRGITINNLIGFYYGRNPKKFQQDTVLQHSRMYARALNGSACRYPPSTPLRTCIKSCATSTGLTLLSGMPSKAEAHERGVYFIQKDSS